MAFRRTLVTLAATALFTSALSAVRADVVLPAKWFVRPEEKVVVSFYSGPMKALQRGDDASVVKEGYTPAGDAVKSDGTPNFALYTFDGKKVEAKAAPGADPKSVDLDTLYPDLRKGGSYILVFKDAQPLVIENLYNPGQGVKEYEQFKDKLGGLPDKQRNDIIARYSPTVLHIVPLQMAVIKTSKGDIKATFAYDAAPHTVDNFISLARQNFYDGSAFHRIIKGFMIQGGDSTGNVEGRAGTGGPGYEITAEFSDKTHDRGVLSMARSGEPNSAGSQFFIMHARNTKLDGEYTAFGQVIDGMDAVDEIAKTPVSDENGTVKGEKPAMESVRIYVATPEMYGIK